MKVIDIPELKPVVERYRELVNNTTNVKYENVYAQGDSIMNAVASLQMDEVHDGIRSLFLQYVKASNEVHGNSDRSLGWVSDKKTVGSIVSHLMYDFPSRRWLFQQILNAEFVYKCEAHLLIRGGACIEGAMDYKDHRGESLEEVAKVWLGSLSNTMRIEQRLNYYEGRQKGGRVFDTIMYVGHDGHYEFKFGFSKADGDLTCDNIAQERLTQQFYSMM